MAITYTHVMAWRSTKDRFVLTERDTMLYALGLNVGHDPLAEDQLAFVRRAGLRALPTLATIIVFEDSWMHEGGFDATRVLHGEQRLWLDAPLPTQGTLGTASRITEVYDKGPDRGALVINDAEIYDSPGGRLLARASSTVICRGDGGFGGRPGAPEPPLDPVPLRAPDWQIDHPTLPHQALLYSMSGDENRLHVDPASARAFGFHGPILHGLCTYGIAGYAVVRTACGGDPSRLRFIGARFTAPVVPGETIRTEIWYDAGGIAFRSRVVERDLIVLDRGNARLVPI